VTVLGQQPKRGPARLPTGRTVVWVTVVAPKRNNHPPLPWLGDATSLSRYILKLVKAVGRMLTRSPQPMKAVKKPGKKQALARAITSGLRSLPFQNRHKPCVVSIETSDAVQPRRSVPPLWDKGLIARRDRAPAKHARSVRADAVSLSLSPAGGGITRCSDLSLRTDQRASAGLSLQLPTRMSVRFRTMTYTRASRSRRFASEARP
jgi:hypothetical protein